MAQTEDLEISASDLQARLTGPNAGQTVLVDVREAWETALCALPGSRFVHQETDLESLWRTLAQAPLVVTICHHGVRSYSAALYLRQKGILQTRSLAGGLDAWAVAIDPSMARY